MISKEYFSFLPDIQVLKEIPIVLITWKRTGKLVFIELLATFDKLNMLIFTPPPPSPNKAVLRIYVISQRFIRKKSVGTYLMIDM